MQLEKGRWIYWVIIIHTRIEFFEPDFLFEVCEIESSYCISVASFKLKKLTEL